MTRPPGDGRSWWPRRARRQLASVGPEGRWAFAAAVLLVPTIRLAVRVRGFGPAFGALERRSDGDAAAFDVERARQVGRAVNLVADRPVIGGSCLPRSMVTWFLLRRLGADAVLVLGADRGADGVSAHAWVELHHAVVNDRTDVRAQFGSFELPQRRLRPAMVDGGTT